MFLGFDTSNYTTSVAAYSNNKINNKKQLLTVKKGEKGLRQSNAVFQHTVNMPKLIETLTDTKNIKAVAVSSRPRNIDNSYMPCFLVGLNNAIAVSHFLNVPLYRTSHQIGHILAALYSADCINLMKNPFLAFHVSGGTTEALLVEPHDEEIIKCTVVAQSTDLKAGQLIDRAGVMLGLDFPCGQELETAAQKSEKTYKIKPFMQGADCSLSGAENKIKNMLDENISSEDIAAYVLDFVGTTIKEMTISLINKFGNIPLIYAGGVMSNKRIKNNYLNSFDAYFADPEFSCDNAAGIALYAKLKYESNL